MENDVLAWIQKWYLSHCSGDWEHDFGFRIGTLDNPGWLMDVQLEETELAEKEFTPVMIERSDDDWVHCVKEGLIFKAYGGPLNLTEMLEIFREWAENRLPHA